MGVDIQPISPGDGKQCEEHVEVRVSSGNQGNNSQNSS